MPEAELTVSPEPIWRLQLMDNTRLLQELNFGRDTPFAAPWHSTSTRSAPLMSEDRDPLPMSVFIPADDPQEAM